MDRPSTAAFDDDSVIGFASFAIDLRGGQLLAAGTAVPLRPKTWAVLLHLVRRPGVLVSREDLLDAVWPEVSVTPDTLTKSIGELRAALGDDARAPRFVETVHRRGFRFLETPQPIAAPAASGPAVDGDAPPFVGRDAELHRLHDALARAGRGERQMVLVAGPPGVGKTALLDAFLRAPAVRGSSVRIASGASIEQYGMREAYLPVLEALERLARGPDTARVLAALRTTAPSWLAQMPWLAREEAGLLQRSFRDARPERMLRECVALLETLAADATLVLALEDLHWSDPSTVDILARLGQRRDPARLLIVATYRPAEVAVHEHPLGPMVRALRTRQRCTELELHELSSRAVTAYLAARFPGAVPPPTLAEVLHAHTGGNPLFLRAVVEHMLAQGWILDTAPGWSFAALQAQPDFGVPPDARDMVALQIDGLAPADRRLLEVAGVAGRDCGVAVLAAALDASPDDVESRCEALARHERFLRPVAGILPRRYAFAHELYRRAVYHDLPSSRRQRLHQRVAVAIESQLGDQAVEESPTLTYHFEHAGDLSRAVYYAGLAAARAHQRGAPREAQEYLEHGLRLVARLPATAEGARQEVALRIALGRILHERFGPAADPVCENGERALAGCDADGDPRRRFEILVALCHAYWTRGDAARFDAALARTDAVARQLGDAASRLVTESLHCRSLAERGRFAESRRHAEAVRAAARALPGPPPPTFGADPVVATLAHDALSAWMLGRPSRAKAALRTARELAAAPGVTPFTGTVLAFFESLIAMLDRDPEGCRRGSDTALAIAREHEFRQWALSAGALHAWARLYLGEAAAGLEELRRVRAAYADTGLRVFNTYILAFLAEGRLRTGDSAGGLRAIDEALHVAETTLDRSYWPELWRLKGEILLAPGSRSRPEAEGCFQRAIEVARASEARTLELRAANSLARVWLARGRRDEAHALVADALACVEPAESSDRREARALLGRDAAARRRTAQRPPGRRR